MLIPSKHSGYTRYAVRILNIDLGGGDAPDNSGMNAAAVQEAALSKEQLDWAKQIYAETAPDRAAATARANTVSDAQLEATKKQTALTDDYAAYQKNTFRPLEQGIVDSANTYDTAERRNKAAAEAGADVEMALSNTQGQQTRQLTRMGVNPASGEAMALSSAQGLEKAKALAGASNTARDKVELQGYARKMDAANLGRGLSSAQATSAGVALNQGNSSVANGQAAGNITAQGNQIMTQGYSGAQQGLAAAASTYGNIASLQNQANANDNAWMGAAGSAAGAYMAYKSDKNAKKNVKPVSSKASLAAFRKMPVSNWKYKKGQGDGGNHTGPMAQDVQKGLGDGTAPGGKVIDMISMAGHTINAIKELDKRVAGLESGKRKGAHHG